MKALWNCNTPSRRVALRPENLWLENLGSKGCQAVADIVEHFFALVGADDGTTGSRELRGSTDRASGLDHRKIARRELTGLATEVEIPINEGSDPVALTSEKVVANLLRKVRPFLHGREDLGFGTVETAPEVVVKDFSPFGE